jgi:ABC-type transporter Mla subunit MlaD
MGAQTRVDVLSLEDFHQRLAGRLTEAELVLSKLNTEMQCRPPALGSFVDATSNAQQYTKLHQSYVDRVERLRQAVTAAQEATQRILDNYRTTEARNKANAADIARALGGIDDPLKLEEPRDV